MVSIFTFLIVCAISLAPLVYNPRWDKCFWLTNFRYGGNGNKLKAYIEDVYTHKGYWVEAKQLRFVEEIKE